MSGHSKWSQIKRQKGAADVKRGAVFSRLANAIIVAAKTGGDPNTNFTLKMAIEKARAENMPKENIERAIARGTGESGGAEIFETLYEIIAPHNIGIIVNAVTDNKNRTTSELKNVAQKNNGKLASSGSVTYQFKKSGKITIDTQKHDRDDIELLAIDAGAEDIIDCEDAIIIFTKPNELEQVKKNLERQDVAIKDAGLSYEPINIVKLNSKDAETIINLIKNIESLEDVNEVFTNFDLA
jgi:YebC/PmpR family DNA-binding regulatory protein